MFTVQLSCAVMAVPAPLYVSPLMVIVWFTRQTVGSELTSAKSELRPEWLAESTAPMSTGTMATPKMSMPMTPLALRAAGRGTTTLPAPNGSTRICTCCTCCGGWNGGNGGGGGAETCCSVTVPQKRHVAKPCAFGASSGAEQVGQTKACGTFIASP